MLENKIKSSFLGVLVTLGFTLMAAMPGWAAEAPAPAAKQAEGKGDAPEKPAKSAKDEKDEPVSFGNYLAGRFAESQGDTRNGLRFIEEAVKRDPANKKHLSSLYRMYVSSGKLTNAQPIALKLVGTKVVDDGSEFSPEMFLAISYAKQGNYAKAEHYLQLVPKPGFNSLLSPLIKAWIKFAEGKIKTPLEMKDVIADQRLVLPHVYLNLAYINDLAGFDAQARTYYEAAVKDPNNQALRAVQALAGFYVRHDETQKYTTLVNGYLAAHGNSLLPKQLLQNMDKAKAAPLVKDAQEGIAETFYMVASLFHGVRAPADEVATLNFALYMRPDFPEAQFLIASAHEVAEDYTSAMEAYKAINKDSPYFVRGQIRSLYDESEIDGGAHAEESLAKLTQMAAERPDDLDALLAKGDILRVKGRYKEAVETYTEAANRLSVPEKSNWVLYFSRGASYERLGNWDEAEKDMKKALELSPGEPDVLNYLGYSWLSKQRNIAEAKKMIEEAFDARPEDAHIIDSMGYALYVSGDFNSAQEYFQQALERTPDDPTVNDHLGDTYWQLGHKTEARFQWNKALAQEKDAATRQLLQQKLEKGIPLKAATHTAEDKKINIELPADE